MIPQKQLFRHEPSAGIYGDCHRTAIACLLDMAPGDVPHFYDRADEMVFAGGDVQQVRDQWLAQRDLCEIGFPYNGDADLAAILTAVAGLAPAGMHMILGGRSKNGCNHSVIVRDGEIVWDPSLDDSGIVGPCDDGFWWISMLVKRT